MAKGDGPIWGGQKGRRAYIQDWAFV